MKITREWLAQKNNDGISLVKALIKEEKYSWANWLIVRIMNKGQKVTYAIYAARRELNFYEKEYQRL